MAPTSCSINPAYMEKLYEVLLSSIGLVGDLENYNRNYWILYHIVTSHYDTNECIRDLSADKFVEERAELFRPYYGCDAVFHKTGLYYRSQS